MRPQHELVPVLEIGGTHLTAALVEPGDWSVVADSLVRKSLAADGSAEELLGSIAAAGTALNSAGPADWAIAIPGPFDYDAGVGRYQHVGKFDTLRGVNLRDELNTAITPAPASITFLNDADAFGIGEYAVGAARGQERAVCLTLGTGIGSAFLQHGVPIKTGPDVPPDGSAHLLSYQGKALEETVSRRAIRAAYAAAAGDAAADVRDIAERARGGDPVAAQVLFDAFADLGRALAASIHRFGATVLVIGGSMARSWDLVEPALRAGLTDAVPQLAEVPIHPAGRPDDAALSGAAYWVGEHRRR